MTWKTFSISSFKFSTVSARLILYWLLITSFFLGKLLKFHYQPVIFESHFEKYRKEVHSTRLLLI